MRVSLFDTKTPVAPLLDSVREAIDGVIASGAFILGPNVAAFEEEFASFLGTRHAVGVANGTEAITIALRALGVGPGDEVIVPSFTFYASAEAIPPTGATPVFCDVDPETFLVTADSVKAVMTPKTKAVVAVHLFGNVAPVQEIEALGVRVVEDTAQASGARGARGTRAGALGTISTFSFFPSKNLGCFGDGGAIATNDDDLADRVRMLRFHGSYDKVSYEHVGYNSRLDEMQAAILRVFLPHLDEWCEGRRDVARRYAAAGLGEVAQLPLAPPGTEPAWGLYVINSDDADGLSGRLAAAEIDSRGYYRVPVHRQAAMRPFAGTADLPGTDRAAAKHLALPMAPTLTDEQIDRVVVVAAGQTSPA